MKGIRPSSLSLGQVVRTVVSLFVMQMGGLWALQPCTLVMPRPLPKKLLFSMISMYRQIIEVAESLANL